VILIVARMKVRPEFVEAMRPTLLETPRIINVELPGEDRSRMGELEILP
jgi:hypothetical protein